MSPRPDCRHIAAIRSSARAGRSHLPDLQIPPYVRQRRDCQQPEGRGGGRHGYCSDVSECSHRVPPVLQLIGVSGPALESPGRGGDSSVRAPGSAGVVAGRLPAVQSSLRSWRAGRGCGLDWPVARGLRPALGGRCGRAQRCRSIMTSTVITIRMVAPAPPVAPDSWPPPSAGFRCYPQATLESQN